MIEELIRPHLKDFRPYVSARSETVQGEIFLDANEMSAAGPISFDGVELNRYPDPNQLQLRTKLASLSGIFSDSVFVGVGSDEIIDLLFRLFCEPSIDSAIILEPTYGVYRVAADLNRVRAVGVELDDVFQIDVTRTLNAVGPTTKLIFCCSPNNPTGNPLRREDILAFTERFNGVVVVDEAYVEFSSSPSLVHDVAARENLVVLRTLSKAWGLAGIRVGYCIAHPLLVEYLLRIKSPYNVNAVSSALALNTLECDQAVKARVRELIAERDRLGVELTTLPIVRQVYPSNANFLLVRFADSARAFAALLASGVVVRRRSEQRLHECLRITVGTPQENEAVLNVLSELEG